MQKSISEFEFIETLKRGAICRPDGIDLGIGDDAAVFAPNPQARALISTDLLVENVHFLYRPEHAYYIGRKSVAVNLSDMAAMGAIPRHIFISLAKPRHVDFPALDLLYRGMQDIAHEFGVNILGGDTTSAPNDLTINVAIYGEAPANEIITRGGGQPGDLILTTGFLGDANAGLEILRNNPGDPDNVEAYLLDKLLNPKPQVAEGRFLAQTGLVTAMLDISDGLSSDISHLNNISGGGATLWESSLPISPQLRTYARMKGLNAEQMALTGGDDYVLLFLCPGNKVNDLMALCKNVAIPLFSIGILCAEPGYNLQKLDGDLLSLPATGWDHFK